MWFPSIEPNLRKSVRNLSVYSRELDRALQGGSFVEIYSVIDLACQYLAGIRIYIVAAATVALEGNPGRRLQQLDGDSNDYTIEGDHRTSRAKNAIAFEGSELISNGIKTRNFSGPCHTRLMGDTWILIFTSADGGVMGTCVFFVVLVLKKN